MLRKAFLSFFLVFLVTNLYSNSKQSSQLIQSGHWIYDDLTVLEAESKHTMFLENQPMSVGEIRFYLKNIDYEALSDSGKLVYQNVKDFLDKEDDFIDNEGFRLFLNARANVEGYVKSNKDIDWSFYTNFKDYPITFPIIIGFSDYFTIESDLFLGKTPAAGAKPKNFTNIPISMSEFEFYLPNFAYFSGAKAFENWGITAQFGKEGMKIGNTSLGSIIYNDTFETDFYAQLSLYSKYLKYSMNVNQVDNTKFYYIHNMTLHPFKNFNIGVVEGSLLNAPFELRYLNPLMLMHQFGSWYQYDDFPNHDTKETYEKYGEGRFCAFLGFTFEFLPIKNLRIYGLYAQNEILDLGGSRSDSALSVPDSIGGQLGAEYFIPMANQAYIKTALEAVYTSPYLYVKHSPDWSLYRYREDMQGPGSIYSWMGSPFGPDCFAVQTRVEYETNKKWSVGSNMLFSIHGENTAQKLFDKNNHSYVYKKDADGKDIKTDNWYWNYYPSVQYQDGKTDAERKEAVHKGRYMWMTGTPEFKSQISVDGHYNLLPNLDFSGQFIYTFVFNNKNILDNFAQGVELAVAVTYELF